MATVNAYGQFRSVNVKLINNNNNIHEIHACMEFKNHSIIHLQIHHISMRSKDFPDKVSKETVRLTENRSL